MVNAWDTLLGGLKTVAHSLFGNAPDWNNIAIVGLPTDRPAPGSTSDHIWRNAEDILLRINEEIAHYNTLDLLVCLIEITDIEHKDLQYYLIQSGKCATPDIVPYPPVTFYMGYPVQIGPKFAVHARDLEPPEQTQPGKGDEISILLTQFNIDGTTNEVEIPATVEVIYNDRLLVQEQDSPRRQVLHFKDKHRTWR